MKKIIYLFLIVHCSMVIDNCLSQWVQVSNGMGYRTVQSIAYSGNNIFAGTQNIDPTGVFLSTNNGANWTQTSLNDQYIHSLASNGGNIFAGTNDSGVYRTTNNGTSWTQTSLNNRAVLSLAANGNNIFAGTWSGYGVYKSTDSGTSWTQTPLNNIDVFSLAVNGNYIFAGSGYPGTGVYLSTNNGTTWTPTTLNNQMVYSLVVNGNNIFAGTGNGVFSSTNNGTDWAQTTLNNRTVKSLAVDGNNIFAATFSYGVYVSNDNGANWIQRNEGFPATISINALCIFNNYIFAGASDGYGVYRRPLSQLIGINPISNEVPIQFSLSQNYPNPFNPSTKIRFALPKSSFAKLVIFDALGREVETIVSEQLNAGTYEADWSADKFSSGIYYYKLVVHQGGSSTGDPSSSSGQVFVETKKMVLIK